MAQQAKIVMATVYLKSKSGRSLLLQRDRPPLDVKPYLASEDTRSRAVRELQKLGFTVEGEGITLSISGPPDLFERVCGAKLSLEERTVVEPQGQSRKQLLWKGTPEGMTITALEDVIDGIVVAHPAMPI